MSRLVSRRVKRVSQVGITSDRYEFLGLEQAEPNLGDPLVGPSSVGVNPIKVGTFYQLAAISQYPGERFWSSPVGIGTTLGVISVYANDVLPNSAFSRIHGLNFVGTGVTLETPPVELFDGIGIATVRFTVTDLIAPGNQYEIPYHNPSTGFLSGADNFVFKDGDVGIGTSLPTQKLDIVGSVNISNNLNASGISTLGSVRISSGIITAVTGVVTYYGDGIGLTNLYAEYAKTSGISTSVIGGIASVTSLNVTGGISTLGNVKISSGIVTATSGIITYYGDYFGTFKGTLDPAVEIINATTAVNVIGGIGSITQLQVAGISTFTNGPVLIGSGQSTGTLNQKLQVSGDAYISGNLGIGTTNPRTKLDVDGDITITGNNRRIYGNFGGLPLNSRLYVQTNIEDQPTALAVLPNGTNTQSNISVFNSNDPNNSGIGVFDILGDRLTLEALSRGTGNAPTRAQFYVNGKGITVVDGGSVGIGTTNPESKLHITSSGITTGEALQVDGNIRVGISTTSNYIVFRGVYGDGVNPFGDDQNSTGLRKYSHTYIGERIYDYSGNAERSELLLSKGNDGTTPPGPDRIRLATSGNIVFDTGGSLVGSFEQVGTSTSLITRMIITSPGNIGIGTTNPTSLLDVNGSTRLRGTLNDFNNLPGTSGQILQSTGTGVTWVNSGSVGSGSTLNITEDSTNENQYLTFVTGVGDSSLGISTNVVFNPSTGNLGIGVTNPRYKLHVAGDIYLNSSNNPAGTSGIGSTEPSGAVIFSAVGTGNIDHIWNQDVDGITGINFQYEDLAGVYHFVNDKPYKSPGNAGLRAGGFFNMDHTGTSNQRLQITGGAYVSGSIGVGTTNPKYSLDVFTDVGIGRSLYDSIGSHGIPNNFLSSTETGIQWRSLDSVVAGLNGEWNNRTGERSYRTLYTNDTGSLIWVSVSIGVTTGIYPKVGGGTAELGLDDVAGAYSIVTLYDEDGTNPIEISRSRDNGNANASAVFLSSLFFVPPGKKYRVDLYRYNDIDFYDYLIVRGIGDIVQTFSWSEFITNGAIPQQAVGSNKQIIYNNNNSPAGATNFVYDNSTSYVGIGTTNPESKLHITSSGITTGEALQVDGNIRVGISTTSNYIVFRGVYSDGVNPFGDNESPTFTKYSHTYIGERIYDYSGNATRSELLLAKGNDDNITGSGLAGPDRIRLATSGNIVFDTSTGVSTTGFLYGSFEQVGTSTSLITRMIITSPGNIGIGTTNPTSLLDVNGSTRLRGTLNDFNNLPGTSGQILQSTGTGVTWVNSGSVGSGSTLNITEDSTNENQYLTFVTGVGDSSLGISTNVVFNPSTGNLGIGVTNPNPDVYLNVGPLNLSKTNNTSQFGNLGIGNDGLQNAFISINGNWNPNDGTWRYNTTGNSSILQFINGRIVLRHTESSGVVGSSTTSIYSVLSTSPTRQVGINKFYNDTSNSHLVLDIRQSLYTDNTQLNSSSLRNPFLVGITTTGSIGVGTTNPISKLHIVGDTFVTGIITATDFNSASDVKLKSNIQRIKNPIEKITKIDGVTFNWISNNRPSIGVIADQLQEILPELVTDGELKTVNYNGLIGLLIESIKEQQKQIEELKTELYK